MFSNLEILNKNVEFMLGYEYLIWLKL